MSRASQNRWGRSSEGLGLHPSRRRGSAESSAAGRAPRWLDADVLGRVKDDRQRQTGVAVPWPSSYRSSRLFSCLRFSGGAFFRVRAELLANAAWEDCVARPLGCRSPAESQRPWEPGSERVSGDCRARGRLRASRSCRPHQVPGLPAA